MMNMAMQLVELRFLKIECIYQTSNDNFTIDLFMNHDKMKYESFFTIIEYYIFLARNNIREYCNKIYEKLDEKI